MFLGKQKFSVINGYIRRMEKYPAGPADSDPAGYLI
jgi:hypothetical protein